MNTASTFTRPTPCATVHVFAAPLRRSTCWFSEATLNPADGVVTTAGDHKHTDHAPATTLLALERTIQGRRDALAQQPTEGKPSWTARLLTQPDLLCKKVGAPGSSGMTSSRPAPTRMQLAAHT